MIEDTSELRIAKPNVLATECQVESLAGVVDFATLLKGALRWRPDRIILGEVRGEEARTLLDSFNTGHGGSLATIHANSPTKALRRFCELAMRSHQQSLRDDIAAEIADSVDYVIQAQRTQAGLTISTSSTSGSSTSQTVLPGGQAVYNFTISPTGATTFPAAVSLTVSGLPTGATYAITPATIASGAGATNVTLTINVPKQTAMLQRSERLAPLALAVLLLPFSGRMRRRAKGLARLAAMLLLLIGGAAGMATVTGCGSTTGFFGQAPQTYNVTITGTSGALTHSTTVTLNVQ